MDNFVQVYKKWLEIRGEYEKLPLTKEIRIAMARCDNAKKRLWNSLPEARRLEIVAELVSEGVFPQSVAKCMEIFEARVVSI